MVATTLFFIGVGMTVITGVASWFSEGEGKRGVVAFPFALLASAAVARYLGM